MPQAVPLPTAMPANVMKRANHARNATHLSTNMVDHRQHNLVVGLPKPSTLNPCSACLGSGALQLVVLNRLQPSVGQGKARAHGSLGRTEQQLLLCSGFCATDVGATDVESTPSRVEALPCISPRSNGRNLTNLPPSPRSQVPATTSSSYRAGCPS